MTKKDTQQTVQQVDLPARWSGWHGFRLPWRPLTDFEIEVFTPICTVCDRKAVVVEKQGFSAVEDNVRELSDFTEDELKFYCKHHAPDSTREPLSEKMDVSTDQVMDLDMEIYLELAVPLICPRFEHRRFMHNCISYNPGCLRRCTQIQELLDSLELGQKEAAQIVRRMRTVKTNTKTNTP